MHPAARPPRSSTFARAPTRVTSNDARVRAATLSPSRMRPRRRCSVPRKPWLRNRASSCARMTARHPLALRSSNTAVSLAPRASLRRLCLGLDRARHRQGGDRAGFAVSNTVGAAKRECPLPRCCAGSADTHRFRVASASRSGHSPHRLATFSCLRSGHGHTGTDPQTRPGVRPAKSACVAHTDLLAELPTGEPSPPQHSRSTRSPLRRDGRATTREIVRRRPMRAATLNGSR